MPFPRRCQSCKCYIADWLKKCPRCGKTAPAVLAASTKDERDAARAKRDANVPTIHQQNMRWVPSAFAVACSERSLVEIRRKLSDAETPALRNALKSELRLLKQTIAKTADGNHRWTHEIFHTKHTAVQVFISPKQHRYVLATDDAKADLIVQNRKSVGIPITRLQRFEKSKYARMVKDDAKDAIAHKKRTHAKQQKRKQRQTLVQETAT